MLADWLLHALAVSGLVAASAWVLERLLVQVGRRVTPLWLVALLVSFFLPLVQFVLGRVMDPADPTGTMSLAGLAAVQLDWLAAPARHAAAALRSLLRSLIPATPPASLLLWFWGISSATALAWVGSWLLLLHRRKRRWIPADLGGVSVLVSRETGPAVVGLLEPRIVVPRWVLSMEGPHQRIVLLHELEHLRSQHGRLLVGAYSLAALAPWNLPLWWQLRRLRLAVELDCDQATLGRTLDPLTYGRLLIAVAARGGSAGLAAFGLPRREVERRLRRLVTSPPRRPRTTAWAASALASILLLAALFLPPPASGRNGRDVAADVSTGARDSTTSASASGVASFPMDVEGIVLEGTPVPSTWSPEHGGEFLPGLPGRRTEHGRR